MNNFDFGNGSNVFFTSDTHFNHENIIHLCERPFCSSEEMDETLIYNWNRVVGKNDIVFHLGDFAFGGSTTWNKILEQLNGTKILILGNHDRKNLKDNSRQYFDTITQQMEIKIDGWSVILNHYPLLCFGGAWSPERLVMQLFGHVHYYPHSKGLDCNRLKDLFPSQYDVGVDNNKFTPVRWSDIRRRVEAQMYHGINMVGNEVGKAIKCESQD